MLLLSGGSGEAFSCRRALRRGLWRARCVWAGRTRDFEGFALWKIMAHVARELLKRQLMDLMKDDNSGLEAQSCAWSTYRYYLELHPHIAMRSTDEIRHNLLNPTFRILRKPKVIIVFAYDVNTSPEMFEPLDTFSWKACRLHPYFQQCFLNVEFWVLQRTFLPAMRGACTRILVRTLFFVAPSWRGANFVGFYRG